VAKFRAARRIYARVMDEWYGAEADAAKQLKFHTQTAGQSLTAQQPLNNVVRVTIQALAGVLGGTQSLHTNSFDEALALPSEQAVRVALRTQQIIAEESGAADIVDPLGGSFAVEALTDEVEAEATAYIEEIKDMGDGSVRDGVLHGIDEGYFHREIQQASYEYQERVDSGDETVVGVNAYEIDPETEPDLLRVDETTRERQLDRLESVKAERDDDAVEGGPRRSTGGDRRRRERDAGDRHGGESVCDDGRIMAVFEAEHGTYRERIDRRFKRGIRETIRPQIGSTGCADSARHAFPGGRCAGATRTTDPMSRFESASSTAGSSYSTTWTVPFRGCSRSVVVPWSLHGFTTVYVPVVPSIAFNTTCRLVLTFVRRECRGRRGRVPRLRNGPLFSARPTRRGMTETEIPEDHPRVPPDAPPDRGGRREGDHFEAGAHRAGARRGVRLPPRRADASERGRRRARRGGDAPQSQPPGALGER